MPSASGPFLDGAGLQFVMSQGANAFLPIPQIEFTKYATNDGGIVKVTNNWTGAKGKGCRVYE